MQEERALQNMFADVTYSDLVIDNSTHTYHPYTVNAFDNSDEIRLIIEKSDLITATYDSKIYIEGSIVLADATQPFKLNDPLFLFDEIRFQLGDVIIDSCRTPGIASSIYGQCRYTPGESKSLDGSGWCIRDQESSIYNASTRTFSVVIPLNHVLGFACDYTRDIVNMRQELILIRSNSDLDCYTCETGVAIKISKVNWRVPHITPNDAAKLQIYNRLKQQKAVKIGFYGRSLYQYPSLPTTSNLVIWPVMNSVGSRRPRWLFTAFQQNKRNNKSANACVLSQCGISDVTAYINQNRSPYEKRHNDFSKNKYVLAYDDYLTFQKKFLNKQFCEPLLNYKEFGQGPIFVLDVSKQNEVVHEPVLSLKLEIASKENFGINSSAYVLILHDAVYEYEPISGVVTYV